MLGLILSGLFFYWAWRLLKSSPVKYHEVDRIRERKEPVEYTPDFTEWRQYITDLRNGKI